MNETEHKDYMRGLEAIAVAESEVGSTRYWSTELQRWVYPEVAVFPKPAGHVTMQTPRGAPDGVKWTGWALAHGAPLYSVENVEQAIDAERKRLAALFRGYAERGTDLSLSDVARIIERP